MKIAILRERQAGESRVAATPETVGKLKGFGATITVEKGAGVGSSIPDAAFKEAGATVAATAAATIKGADVVLTVRRPTAAQLKGAAKGALVIGGMDPFGNEKELATLAKTGASVFAMEFMPRITRAQVMDILSSQANLAGYQAVIDAATAFDRAMPMMMTAAGTVRPAKAFVMGAGVAGLQAIATAKRLGAVVTATDVRAAAAEQIESLGGKFIMTDALKDASGEGGYARELTKDEQAAQAELVAGHIAKQDMVITTALIPGRPAPKLVTKAMVESMAPGSVIVDLAAERGGNCELTKADKIVNHKGVTIIGHTNMAGRIASSASNLYARNLIAFLETLLADDKKSLKVDWEDELVVATLLTRDGKVVHERFVSGKPVAAKKPAAKPAAAKKPATRRSSAAKTGAASKTASAAPKAAAKKPAAKKPAAKTAAAKTGAVSKTASAPKAVRQPAAAKKPAAKSAAAKTGAVSKTARAAPKTTRKPAAKKPAVRKASATKTGPANKTGGK